jgi:hypothetical protein
MTRGQRQGALTTAELTARLRREFPHVVVPAAASLCVLLGHAIHYKLLTDDEIDESTPRVESTLPCYLHTYVAEPVRRTKLRQYAITSSKLFRRGSLILNRVAMAVCGERLPGAGDCRVSVLRPRWSRDGIWSAGARALEALMAPINNRIEGNTLKHAFLPERWPSATVQVNPSVAAVLASDPHLPQVPPNWLDVMGISGWDNAINRMMTKYFGNVKVHARAGLDEAVHHYLWDVPLAPDAPRALLADSVIHPLRPLIASDDDWEMVIDLRGILQGINDGGAAALVNKRREWFIRGYTSDCTPEYSPDVLRLHLFLTRFGSRSRSYLPVAKRSRKYAYVDAIIAGQLFGVRGRGRAGESSLSVGQMMGFTPEIFNKRRKELRRQIRRKKRSDARTLRPHHRLALSKKQRKRATGARKKDRERWAGLGASRMPRGTRIDSFETDGVGLRLVLKTKISITALVRPFAVSDDGAPTAAEAKAVTGRKKRGQPAPVVAAAHPNPIVVASDLGRAKLFVSAISQSARVKPASFGFTRRQYYYEMGYSVRRRWEAGRMAGSLDLQAAIEHLSESEGVGNCDSSCWDAYLQIEEIYRDILDEEYVENDERPRWTMRMFRAKRRSLDRAVQRQMDAALTLPSGQMIQVDRPLVFGVGAAGFSSNGRAGELPAPTSELSKALSRAIKRVRATGRQVVTLSPDEFRTTMCCCACGAVTVAPSVRRRRRDRGTGETITEDGPSRRLRCCTSCSITGKLRDRDVQGARNILWLTYALYYGYERPQYLSRKAKAPIAEPNTG